MLIRACGLDLSMELARLRRFADAELEQNLRLTAAERLDQAQSELARLRRSPERRRSGSDSTRRSSKGSFRTSCSRSSSAAVSSTSRSERSARSCTDPACSATTSTSCPRLRPANLERLPQALIALSARTPRNKQLRLEPGEQPQGRHTNADAIGAAQHDLHARPARAATTIYGARRSGSRSASACARRLPHSTTSSAPPPPTAARKPGAPPAAAPAARPRADDRARTPASSR